MDSNLKSNQTDELAPAARQSRSGQDRRDDSDRRRSANGLFELRARREVSNGDRRRRDRRENAWSWLAFWRRTKGNSEAVL